MEGGGVEEGLVEGGLVEGGGVPVVQLCWLSSDENKLFGWGILLEVKCQNSVHWVWSVPQINLQYTL